jgi:hypothetical protein
MPWIGRKFGHLYLLCFTPTAARLGRSVHLWTTKQEPTGVIGAGAYLVLVPGPHRFLGRHT